jgi:hypothetical protein
MPCLPAVALLQSRSKSAPSAKLEKVALLRRQLEGGRSPDDPPPLTENAGGRLLRLKRRRKSGRESEHNILIEKGKAKPISVTTKVSMKVTTKVLTKVA